MSGRLVILDRDGVINHDSPDYIKSAEEWRPIPGSLEAIALLHRDGWRVCVASNQSGVGRGLFSLAELERIHAKMSAAVTAAGGNIARIAYCPHRPDEGCGCRKPAIGLLEEIARSEGIPLAGVPFIGDAASDVEAALRAGCRPILVRTGKGQRTAQSLGRPDVPIFDDLAGAVRALLAEKI